MKPQPPRRALKFLRWFCREDYIEEIEGDLMEVFEKQFAQSPRKAKLKFQWSVLKYFRPEFIKSFRYTTNHTDMLHHHLLIAYRSYLRHKGSFAINLAGLSTGLACALLIYLWVADESSMDKFHEKGGQLYQIMNNLQSTRDVITFDITPVPLASALSEEIPEVEYAVSVNDFFSWDMREGVLSAEEKHAQVKGWHAGRDFFNVFSYDLIRGNKDQVLSDKNNVVISEELSKKLFHTTEDVIGKTLKWKHPRFEGTFQVSGIFKSPPPNSTAQFDFLLHIDIVLDHDRWAKQWTGNYAQTYVVLKKGSDVSAFNEKIATFLKSKNERNRKFTLFAQRYSDRYLHGQYDNGKPAGGRVMYVQLFSIVAVFVLLIACVNFMNLSTAKAVLKMKEIGVKKTIGASRKTLIAQFLSESLLTTFVSLLVAVLLVALLLPLFNQITGKHLSLHALTSDILVVAAIVLVTGLLSGSYPAFFLSAFKPVAVLKGELRTSVQGLFVRKGLVIFQFALSVIFIVGLLVVNEQIKFTQTKNLGYNRDNILSFQWKGEVFNAWNGLLEGKSNEKFETFIAGLKNVSGVVNATHISGNILNDMYGQSGVSWRGQEDDRDYVFTSPIVGYDFIETLGITMKEGRSFSKAHHDNYQKIILNEAAVDLMEIKDPVGKIIDMNGGSEIIGVVKDFHYGSLHNPLKPLIFRCDPAGRTVMVKVKAGMEQHAIEQLSAYYRQFLPDNTLDITFMDDDYQALYESENKVAVLSQYFAVIALIISCLGLFGLTAFTAQRRLKEISLRKIFGATDAGIVGLLSADFTKTVLLAIVIALPVSYFMAQQWLESFAYRMDLEWWIFAAAGVVALLVAWITVSVQTIGAARVNPSECLQSE